MVRLENNTAPGSESRATAGMKIGAVAPWFGGKRTLASTIVARLGEHRAYWEPFAGGMSVLLAKPPAAMETVNDLHADLINLARVVQREETAVALFERMSRTLMHEGLFDEAVARLRGSAAGDVPDVDRAYDWMLVSWLGRNGVAGTKSYNFGFCVRYTKNGGHAATRFRAVAESIPAWFERLRHVTILRRNAREVISRIEDAKGVAVYCDPPYVVKGAEYEHDFGGSVGVLSGADAPMTHQELAVMLSRFTRARVVVSYYDHPLVRDLYREADGWRIVECHRTKALANQGQRDAARREGGAAVAPEILIVRGGGVA